jgi:hypothetical protein
MSNPKLEVEAFEEIFNELKAQVGRNLLFNKNVLISGKKGTSSRRNQPGKSLRSCVLRSRTSGAGKLGFSVSLVCTVFSTSNVRKV